MVLSSSSLVFSSPLTLDLSAGLISQLFFFPFFFIFTCGNVWISHISSSCPSGTCAENIKEKKKEYLSGKSKVLPNPKKLLLNFSPPPPPKKNLFQPAGSKSFGHFTISFRRRTTRSQGTDGGGDTKRDRVSARGEGEEQEQRGKERPVRDVIKRRRRRCRRGGGWPGRRGGEGFAKQKG